MDLRRALREVQDTKAKLAQVQESERVARKAAQQARVKLRKMRILEKLARIAAHNAEDQAAELLELLERAQIKVESYDRRAKKRQRTQKCSTTRRNDADLPTSERQMPSDLLSGNTPTGELSEAATPVTDRITA